MAAAGAAGVVWPAALRGGESFPSDALAYPRLLGVLRDPRVVRDLGRRYRQIVPAESAAPVLARAILAESGPRAAPSLQRRVDARVRQDFASGRTVTLNGWVLAVTEARQCALYSLLPA